MYVTYIGHNHVHDMDFEINRPNGSGDYLALLIKSYGLFYVGGEEQIVEPNTFFLYKKGTPQYYKAYKEPFSNDWFHFELEKGEESYFEDIGLVCEVPIKVKSLPQFSMMIKEMTREKYVESEYSKQIIEHYMHVFFLKMVQERHLKQVEGTEVHYDKMSLLRSKIYSRPYEKWCVEGLAHEVTLSPYYFQRLYKKLFGVPCMTDIIHARIEYAKYYLVQTELSVKYIAELSGYENSEHFMRQFKKLEGQTPTEYRKSYR